MFAALCVARSNGIAVLAFTALVLPQLAATQDWAKTQHRIKAFRKEYNHSDQLLTLKLCTFSSAASVCA
jgi:hypothetical protein